jgi:hypothetical protein
MTTPVTPDTSAAAPLDAERARLRSAGYTDAEVSQILIARVSQQPAGAGQGVMSNALSSIVAVASHARAVIPTFRKDVATVFDGGAAASERAGATASLAVKAVVILVLGYAAWQEWRIHIAYNPELAHQQLLKAKADAESANTRSRPTLLAPQSTEPETELQQVERVARERCAAGEQQICEMLKQMAATPGTSDQRVRLTPDNQVMLPTGPNGQFETLIQRIDRVDKELNDQCDAGDPKACALAGRAPK